MATVLLAIGLVLAVEGLALALAPGRIDEVLALFARLGPERRRLLGLAVLAAGVAVIGGARLLGA